MAGVRGTKERIIGNEVRECVESVWGHGVPLRFYCEVYGAAEWSSDFHIQRTTWTNLPTG